MKKFLSCTNIFLISLLTLFFFSNCVRYYRTGDIHRQYADSINKINATNNKANAEYKKREVLLNSILPHLSAERKNKNPYPRMKKQLAQVKSALDRLNTRRAQVLDTNNKLQVLTRGKGRIKSNMPEWDGLSKLNDTFKDNLNAYSRDVRSFESKVKAFDGMANKYKITRVNTAQLKARIRKFNNQVVATVNSTKSHLAKAKKNLVNARSMGYDASVIDKKEAILAKMNALLPQINAKNNEIIEKVKAFEKEAGARGEFWAGPGMATHTILVDIQAKGGEMTKLGNQFQGLVNQYNAAHQPKK
ncbi:MAG: hypothetical protein GY754_13335 [bacterium]|nr:hypothetical protein [bacterium]